MVMRVTASTREQVDSLMDQVNLEFAGFAHRQFSLDQLTLPLMEARLAMENYALSTVVMMLLEGPMNSAIHDMVFPIFKAKRIGTRSRYCTTWTQRNQYKRIQHFMVRPAPTGDCGAP